MLTYLTAGLAVTNFNFSESVLLAGTGQALAGSVSTTDVGWTVGAGVEYGLSWNWSIKVEYLYVNFANQTASQAVPGFPSLTGTATANLNASIVRGGFNYRF
jgi:outer membrane immunogenic protein